MPRKDIKDDKGVTRMVIETDDHDRFVSAKDSAGNLLQSGGQAKDLIFDGKAVIHVSDGSAIVTKHNPTCLWYFVGGNWYRVCW